MKINKLSLTLIVITAGLVWFAIKSSTPPKVPLSLRPPVTLMGAEQILDGDGWEITNMSKDPSYGCIEGKLNGEQGKLCFFPCEERSAQQISQEIGPTYGYQIGNLEKCASYTTFEGSSVFRSALFPIKN